MSRIHFEQNTGRAVMQYPRELNYQPQYVDIDKDGKCFFSWNGEIGNAEPESVWNGRIIRITFNNQANERMTQADRRQFYSDNKGLFKRIVDGLGEKWDGNNWKGTLTEDAKYAYEKLQHNAENFYPAW